MKRILSLLICATIILSAFSFVMPVYASNEETFIEYIYIDDFSTTDKMSNYTYSTNFSIWNNIYDASTGSFATNYSLTDNKTLKITGTGNNLWTKLRLDAAGKPKLVLSFDINLGFTNYNKGYYFGTAYKGGSEHGMSSLYLPDNDKVGVAHTTTKYTSKTYTKGKWFNVTLVYDNDSNKANNRDIYINGEYAGTYPSDLMTPTSGYNYAKAGALWFTPNFLGMANADTVELDNIEIYAYPSELKYELVSVLGNEVKLNFNMFPDPATVIPENFIVKSGSETITPDTAKISTDDLGQVVLTFSEDLTPGKTYTVSAANLTAGNNDGDVGNEISLATNHPELSFSIAIPPVEWTATNEMFLFDYEKIPVDTTVTADESQFGFIGVGNGGKYTVETVNEKKSVLMEQNNTEQTGNGTFVRYKINKSLFTSDKYAFEMKVKTDFSQNPDNAVFDTMVHSTWGLPFAALYKGCIYTNGGLEESVGTYTDREWVTLKNVYYSSPVNNDGTNYLRRDIYVNGHFVKTVYDSWDTYKNNITGADDCMITFRVRDKDVKIDTKGKVYIDYFRVYAPQVAPAVQLASMTDVDTSYINVKFNSTPVETDLKSKIYIADENGTKVSDISVPEFVNEFNAQGYAAKVNLWFEDELELGETYKLCIYGVSDIAGNKLYQEETFTTKSKPEAQDLKLVNGIASVTVNECSEPLTLYVVGYNFVDGVEQMTTVDTIEITATGDHSTTEPVTGSIVKAFLWKGTKPVIACESASEGNN